MHNLVHYYAKVIHLSTILAKVIHSAGSNIYILSTKKAFKSAQFVWITCHLCTVIHQNAGKLHKNLTKFVCQKHHKCIFSVCTFLCKNKYLASCANRNLWHKNAV